jgi:hypothetical protein
MKRYRSIGRSGTGVLLATGLVLLLGGAAQTAAARAPSLAGTWAMEGTGPAGFVAAGGRVATLAIHQRGRTLAVQIRSGGATYTATGTSYWPKPRVSLTWRMATVGTVRFDGTLQPGSTRVLGAWADARGDDGGALLVRLSR